jgi:hypothetical protein
MSDDEDDYPINLYSDDEIDEDEDEFEDKEEMKKNKFFEDDDEDDEDDEEIEYDEEIINKKNINNNSIISSKIITKYEYDRLIGSLSLIIDLPHFKVPPKVFELSAVKNEDGDKLDNSLDIAKQWVKFRKEVDLPVKLNREMLNNTHEELYIEDMILLEEL